MKKQNFLQGAIILVFASLVVKIFGAIFKIPLTNIIGVTAMAYFNTAYGFYVIFYMISTAGIPVALSKMISEAEAKDNKKEIQKIFRVAYILFFFLGVAGTILMVLFSKDFSSYVHLDGLHYSILSISITLFFMCLTSAYRGYFQGLKNMVPTAVSQIIGAVGKLFIGLLVAYVATVKGYSPHVVAALTLLGITTGSIGSTIYLWIYKKINDKKETYTINQISTSTTPSSSLLKKLIIIAIPITLSATILSLTNTIDTTLMVRRLVVGGIDKLEATKIMGAYTSMAVPINNLAPNLIYPFAISAMPAITTMFASGKEAQAHSAMNSTLRIAAIISIPCTLGLSFFSKPIVNLLYDNKETITFSNNTYLETDLASDMLSILAISIFFISMVSVTNAILQAYGKESKTIISTSTGIVIKLILNYFLISNETYGIYGAPIATLICYMTIMIMNFVFIKKYTTYFPKLSTIIVKPLASAIIGIGGAACLYKLFPTSKIAIVLFITLAAILYFLVIFVIKGIEKEDIRMLPKGKKIENLLIKVKLMK